MSNSPPPADRASGLTGARLPPEQRREQLIDIAIDLFGDPTKDNVSLDDVARAAGISRNLVYHYFPGKTALIAAAVRTESTRLAHITDEDQTLRGPARLAAALNAYFDYVEAHPHAYRLIYRFAAANAETRALLDNNQDVYSKRILSWLDDPSPATELAVRSWMYFLTSTCLRWLDTPEVSRQEVMHLCGQMLVAALAASGHELP
ncbi:transcriptional regulator, TetR family [Frankineae bacterium MT45]|nr:transcriptional regulator, TetR family [Frankineae bacterium MT45]